MHTFCVPSIACTFAPALLHVSSGPKETEVQHADCFDSWCHACEFCSVPLLAHSVCSVCFHVLPCRNCTLTKLKSLRQKANSGRLKRCTVLSNNMTWPSICTSSTACGTMSCAWCHSTARYVSQPCCFSSSSTLPVLPCLLHPFSLWLSLLLLHDVIRAYFA